MAEDDKIRRLAGEQRRRFVASVMGAAETSGWWSKMTAAEQRDFRSKVLNSVGVYHDFMLDVIKVSNEDSIRNELALDLIEQVHDSQRRLERQLARPAGALPQVP